MAMSNILLEGKIYNLHKRAEDLEIYLYEIDHLLVELWGHLNPDTDPEVQKIVNKLMECAREIAGKL